MMHTTDEQLVDMVLLPAPAVFEITYPLLLTLIDGPYYTHALSNANETDRSIGAAEYLALTRPSKRM